MKKFTILLLMLILSVSVFASSVSVGGAFNFINGKTAKDDDGNRLLYKSSGIGFDVAGTIDLNKTMAVWADFNMTFGFDVKNKEENNSSDWVSMKDMLKGLPNSSLSILNMSFGLGVAYKLSLDLPIELSVGGGLFFEHLTTTLKTSLDDNNKSNISGNNDNLGMSLYLNAKYNFSEKLGLNFTIMPHFGLYSLITQKSEITSMGISTNSSEKHNGFAFSFSMPITLSVSYSL